jgi:purine-binding chemotaxis protein CheW
MNDKSQVLIFFLGENQYGLPLEFVEHVTQIVEITPLPGAPDVIAGVIDYHGEVIPVYDIRRRFNLSPSEISLSDLLIIVKTDLHKASLIANGISGLQAIPQVQYIPPQSINKSAKEIDGVTATEQGIVLIHNPDTFFSESELKTLEKSIKSLKD